MTFRDRLALTLPPLLIRLCLAATFVWAGLGKFSKMDYDAQTSADLANAGVSVFESRAVEPGQRVPPSETDDLPLDSEAEPEATPPADKQPTMEDETSEAEPPADEPEVDEEPASEDPSGTPGLAHADPGYRLVLVQNQGEPTAEDVEPAEATDEAQAAEPDAGRFSAANFPNGVRAFRLYGIAGSLAGSPLEPYAGSLAWICALTELIGGLLLIPGVLSRVWGLGLAINMAVAIWLTTITPSLGDPNAFLGFWPSIAPAYGSEAWWDLVTGFWQLALGTMALAIFLGGPGRISVDSLFFGPGTSRKAGKQED